MLERTYTALNFDDPARMACLVQISATAQSFFKKILPKGKTLKFSVEVDSDGKVQISTEKEPWEALARQMGIQARLDFLVGGYHVRLVDFTKLHQVSHEDLDHMVDALLLTKDCMVLDLMCGYGAVSERILENAKKKGLSIKLHCADLYLEQINRMKEDLRKQICDIRLIDARSLPYADNTFDVIFIKMGVHDVPHQDQKVVFDEVFRILKPGGRFVVWEILTNHSEEQDAFSAQINKKDSLAGYESFLIDRYFLRPDQLITLYKNSNFTEIEEVFCAHFKEGTQSRLDSELHNDQNKLNELNDFTRQCIPNNIRSSMHYEDSGNNISMVIPNRVFRAVKPFLKNHPGS